MLAYQKVRYVGEAIAAVAADTPEAALAGVQAIICELEPLPAVFDPDHALDPDAPQIGPDRPDGKHPNFLDLLIVRKDDPLAELEKCAVVLDQRYTVGPQEHAYIEPEGVLAVPTREGGVIVYAPNQSPFVNHGNLAMVLDLPHNLVRVIQPPVGGSFGGKDDIIYESSAQVAKLALVSGRPVRMIFSREESMIASYKRDAMRMRIRLGADRDGTLRACKFEGMLDSGAYASEATFTAWRASIHAMGAYRYDACDVDIACVYTNNGYSGAFRGFGNTEVCSAIEQAIDEVADAVGMDPIDFRLKNCLRVGDETAHGQILTESVGLPDCLKTVRRISDWDRKRAEYRRQSADAGNGIRRGIGVAALFHGTSLGAEGSDYASSTISIEQNYSIDLTSGLTDYGTGSRTVFTLIAAEELGVSPERIHMQRPDTDTAVESGPTVASRSTMLGGNATRIATGNLRQTLDYAAADLLGCELHQLVRHGEAYVGPTEEPVSWEKVVDHAREMGLTLSAHGKWTAPTITWDHHAGRGTPYMAYHFAAQVAEVEVDMRTGNVQVIGFWAVHDPGKVIFPQGAYGQLYGGIAQGLGYALMEQITYAERLPAGDQLRVVPDPDLGGRAGDHGAVRRGAVLPRAVRRQEHRRAVDGAVRAGDPQRHRPRHRPPRARSAGQPGARAAGQGPDQGRVGQGVQAGVEDGIGSSEDQLSALADLHRASSETSSLLAIAPPLSSGEGRFVSSLRASRSMHVAKLLWVDMITLQRYHHRAPGFRCIKNSATTVASSK